MAAVLPAGMVHFAMVCFPLGMASYVNTFVAQYHGAGQPRRIGPAVWQGVRLGLYCIPVFLAMIPLSPWIFRLAGHEAELASLEALFFQTALFGAGAEVIAASLAAFFTGRGVTWVVMVVDSSAWALNIVLDYGWIFGHFGLPALGIEGAAWATVISLWWRVAVYIVLDAAAAFSAALPDSGAAGDSMPPLFRRLLRYGGPSGLQLLVEIAGFTLFLLVVGTLGKAAMAATTLAFNFNTLAFVPMLGLGIALSTLVGQQLGRNNPDLAARATWTSLCMALGYMGAMALVYVLLPDVLLMGHAAGTPPAEFAELRDTTVILLRFVAAYCLFDAMNVVFTGALKGAGDTRFIMIVSLLLTPTAGRGRLGRNPLLRLRAALVLDRHHALDLRVRRDLLARFLQGRWRHMRVIEPELTQDGVR